MDPVTIVVFRTVDAVQSEEAVPKDASQRLSTLSPNFNVNGFAVRAQ
ncbi:MAG: hypothetical protein WKF54_13015 [Nocardioidaceae bacterium]